jgi:hypothetical protein
MKLPIIEIKESIVAYSLRAFIYLFGCAMLIIVFGSAFKEMGNYFKAVIFILLGVCLYVFIYNLRRAFKERIALTLNEEGVFYKKLELLWVNINSYRTYHEQTEDSSSDGMIITMNGGRQFKINIAMLDVDIMTLRRHMEMFCTNMNIMDEGHIETK